MCAPMSCSVLGCVSAVTWLEFACMPTRVDELYIAPCEPQPRHSKDACWLTRFAGKVEGIVLTARTVQGGNRDHEIGQ